MSPRVVHTAPARSLAQLAPEITKLSFFDLLTVLGRFYVFLMINNVYYMIYNREISFSVPYRLENHDFPSKSF